MSDSDAIEHAIFAVIATRGPIDPCGISEALDARDFDHTQTQLRDAIWSLVHQQRVSLTNDRKLEQRYPPMMFDGGTDCTAAFVRRQFEALSVAAFGATCVECGRKFVCKCPACSSAVVESAPGPGVES